MNGSSGSIEKCRSEQQEQTRSRLQYKQGDISKGKLSAGIDRHAPLTRLQQQAPQKIHMNTISALRPNLIHTFQFKSDRSRKPYRGTYDQAEEKLNLQSRSLNNVNSNRRVSKVKGKSHLKPLEKDHSNPMKKTFHNQGLSNRSSGYHKWPFSRRKFEETSATATYHGVGRRLPRLGSKTNTTVENSRVVDRDNLFNRIAAKPEDVKDNRRKGKLSAFKLFCSKFRILEKTSRPAHPGLVSPRERSLLTENKGNMVSAPHFRRSTPCERGSSCVTAMRKSKQNSLGRSTNKADISRPWQNNNVFLADRFNIVHRKPAPMLTQAQSVTLQSCGALQTKSQKSQDPFSETYAASLRQSLERNNKSAVSLSEGTMSRQPNHENLEHSRRDVNKSPQQATKPRVVYKSSWKDMIAGPQRSSISSDLSFACRGVPEALWPSKKHSEDPKKSRNPLSTVPERDDNLLENRSLEGLSHYQSGVQTHKVTRNVQEAEDAEVVKRKIDCTKQLALEQGNSEKGETVREPLEKHTRTIRDSVLLTWVKWSRNHGKSPDIPTSQSTLLTTNSGFTLKSSDARKSGRSRGLSNPRCSTERPKLSCRISHISIEPVFSPMDTSETINSGDSNRRTAFYDFYDDLEITRPTYKR